MLSLCQVALAAPSSGYVFAPLPHFASQHGERLSHGASRLDCYGGIWFLRAALFATRRHRGRVFCGRGAPPPKACPLIQKGTVVSGSPIVTDIATPSALKTRCLLVHSATMTRHRVVVFESLPNSLPCWQRCTPPFGVNINGYFLFSMHCSSQTFHGRAMNGGNFVQSFVHSVILS